MSIDVVKYFRPTRAIVEELSDNNFLIVLLFSKKHTLQAPLEPPRLVYPLLERLYKFRNSVISSFSSGIVCCVPNLLFKNNNRNFVLSS